MSACFNATFLLVLAAFIFSAKSAFSELSHLSNTPAAFLSASKGIACSPGIFNRWPNGYVIDNYTVTNNSKQTILQWELELTFEGNVSVISTWGVTAEVVGNIVTVSNSGYNGALDPGQSQAFGFIGTGNVSQPICQAKKTFDNTPNNPNATNETVAVLRYLAALSEQPFQGAIVGQNSGHTADIYDENNIMSYSSMVESLFEESGKWVGMLALDYEHNRAFKPEEISKANKVLIDYWNAGGLIAVGFSPINPWIIDESDLDNDGGIWKDTRTTYLNQTQLAQIDLTQLLEPETDVHKVWRKKLDRIANGLLELQEAGVVVLFKPMQEQNGFWFWWGVLSHLNDPMPYINLYRDMYNYFTYEKGLNNILWLYSPNRSYDDPSISIKPQMWVYPGADFIDIIAPTEYNRTGEIFGYDDILAEGKPLGMAEYGPDHSDNFGLFDNRTYIQRISGQYPAIGFWINWHDWENGDGTNTYMSLVGNRYYNELMNDPRVITREKLTWKKYVPESSPDISPVH